MEQVYVGIGSNMADPQGRCLEAVKRIGILENCKITSVSGLYLTEPVGVKAQDWFINCVACFSTDFSPFELLRKLLDIESDMGRVRTVKWGPRVIDLDILLFGKEVINDNILTVPHPMMQFRRFVMAPMADVAPDLLHPVLGKTMLEIYREIPPDEQAVRRVEGT
jgi:2-amino-4-hydroxy-6-hydroxymethyldihydropteridine diphosphokinase